MCFRFDQELEDINALMRWINTYFDDVIVHEDNILNGANIALTDPALALIQRADFQLRSMRFGLVPSWKKEPDSKLGNARAETVDELPSFKEAFLKRRCLVPMAGYWEWRQDPGKPKKTPYRVTVDTGLFFVAGLWEYWAPQNIASFALITTEPNQFIAKLHNRMPVIIRPEFYKDWLDPKNTDYAYLKSMLQSYEPKSMSMTPYDSYVSLATNKDKAKIKPVGAPIRL